MRKNSLRCCLLANLIKKKNKKKSKKWCPWKSTVVCALKARAWLYSTPKKQMPGSWNARKGSVFFSVKPTIFMIMSTLVKNKVLAEYKNNHPYCEDGKAATLSFSKSEKNPQRPYFRCGQQQKYKFFIWADRASSKNVTKKGCVEKSTMTEPVSVVKYPMPCKL